MDHHFLLQVGGHDRPGILAAVTQGLYIAGCNLEDVSVARIGDHFAMLVAFSGPAALTTDTVKRALERVRGEMGLTVEVGPLSAKEAKPKKPRGHLALISVHGPDKPGVLFRLSSLMAKLKINMTDVNTHRMAESRHAPGFVLFVEAEIPAGLSLDDVRKKLQALGKELGVSISAKAAKA